MAQGGEIDSGKILVKEIFSQMWFRIPEYQRPYVWTRDEVVELLGDLTFAMTEKPNSKYFMGSFVFQSKTANPAEGQQFDENDLLDGQQRMTTLLILFAVIRDLADDPKAKISCQQRIHQQADTYSEIPERTRLVFAIRDRVQDFIVEYVETKGGTDRKDDLVKIVAREDDISLQNMAQAILEMHKFFAITGAPKPEALLHFVLNNVLLIYVSTEDLEDAFRLFMILNARGIPLRNSDILKSMNLGALVTEGEKIQYAKMWEFAESELGDEFDRFLSHVRTILVKDRPRLSLLQEYEDKIYEPKEKDKSTGKMKPALLKKGKDTFELIARYFSHYSTVLSGQNYDEYDSFEFDNLVKVMETGLPATDWLPPLLRYYDRFNFDRLLEFLKRLDNKFSADLVSQYTPTERIEGMNRVIRIIDDAETPNDVLRSDCFNIDSRSFMRNASDDVYRRRFARYLLLKLDYLYQDHSHRMSFEKLSVEHILPQNPNDESQWAKDFTLDERVEWTNRLGNLVIITCRKNSSQGRLDYKQKKKRYFEKNITTCPNSLRVLNNDQWTPAELEANHKVVLRKLRAHYEIEIETSEEET